MMETCFILSLALLVAGLLWMVFAHRGWRRLGFLICLILADVVLVLPISLAEYSGDVLLGVLQVPYNLLSMFLFEGRIDAFHELFDEGSVVFGKFYFALLQILYIASFAALALMAYGLFTKRFASIRIVARVLWFRFRNKEGRLYVVNGMDTRPRAFLEDLFDVENGARVSRKGKDARLCIVTGISKETLDENSTLAERFRGLPVIFTEMSLAAFCDLFYSNPRRKRRFLEISSVHFFFFRGSLGATANDEGVNISDAIVLLEYLGERMTADECYGADGRPIIHVYIACSGRSDELLLDSIESLEDENGVVKGIDVRVIDEGREIVHDLLWNHPLTDAFVIGAERRPFRVEERQALLDKARMIDVETSGREDLERLTPLVAVIIGMGHYGFEAFRAISWLGQIPGTRLKIFAIDSRPIEVVENAVDFYCPDLLYPVEGELPAEREGRLLDVKFLQLDVKTPAFKKALYEEIKLKYLHEDTVPYVVVSVGNEDLNIDTAILVRQVFYGKGEDAIGDQPRVPQIFVDVYDERRHATVAALKAKGGAGTAFEFTPFGGIRHIFNERYIVDSDIEAIAFNINASYNDALVNGDKDYRTLFGSYAEYQMNRLSSVANAMAIRTKLWMLGFEFDGETSSLAGVDELDRYMKENLGEYSAYEKQGPKEDQTLMEVMARSEHARWRAFYCCEGWSGESVEASNRLKARNLNGGRHDSHILLLHPFICNFDDLAEVAKGVGKGSDPTAYDRKLIREIPLILKDVRGLTGKTFPVKKIE